MFSEATAGRWTLGGTLALVTVSSLGIGLAVAEAFLSLAATVLAVARDSARLKERLEGWRRRGGRAYGLAADVSVEEGRGAVLRRLQEFGAGLDAARDKNGANITKEAPEATARQPPR